MKRDSLVIVKATGRITVALDVKAKADDLHLKENIQHSFNETGRVAPRSKAHVISLS